MIDLEQIIDKNPYTSFDSILNNVLKDKYKDFSFEEISRILVFMKAYYIKVQIIEKLLNSGLNGNQLLEKVLGKKLNCFVSAERYQSTLVFSIYDKNEFARLGIGLYNYKFKGHTNKKSEYRNFLNFTSGLQVGKCNIMELEKSVILLNNKSKFFEKKKTIAHEVQHSINSMLGFDNMQGGRYNFLRLFTIKDFHLIQDEIIAYLKEGEEKGDIIDKLNDENGLYNKFFGKFNNKETYNYFWNMHKKSVNRFVNEAFEIKKYFPKEYITILALIDIRHWNSIVKHLSS